VSILIEVRARTLPHAEKVVLPRQGHSANQTAPADIARVVETLAKKVLC
jgi:pimeloyl-ACP methyl ester carboxylesterase